jgi:hypothetical protein
VGTAPVLNEDGSLAIFSAKDISKAFDRLKDTSVVVGKAFEPPTYVLRFKQECKALQLFDIYDSFYKKPLEERESLFQHADAQYSAAKGKGPKTQYPKVNVAKGNTLSKWKLQTQVATDRPIVPVGTVAATFGTCVSNDDVLPPCKRWVTGVLIKFGTDALCPFEIQWDTQPIPMVQRVTYDDMAQLVENFKSCVKFRLLRGYVGLDLLWERHKYILPPTHDTTGTVLTQLLRYGRVLPFDPATDKYKVVYRDGICTWKTEPEISKTLRESFCWHQKCYRFLVSICVPLFCSQNAFLGATSARTLAHKFRSDGFSDAA